MENLNLTVILTAVLTYIGVALKSLPRTLWSLIKARITSSISVTSTNNYQYDKVVKYLKGLNKKILNDNVLARSFGSLDVNNSIAPGEYTIRIRRGLYLSISITDKSNGDANSTICVERYTILLTFFGLNRRAEHKKLVDELNKSESHNNIFRKIINSESNGYLGELINKRDINTLFINEKERLLSVINTWTEEKEFYMSHGIQYKLGILVSGEPGTGKSTLGRVVASYLNYNLVYVDLSSIDSANKLIENLTQISPKSVIILEDIDCVLGNREDEKSTPESIQLTNAILNFLDGVLSPENCIIIASTNYVDRLDSAVKRPGRFDLQLELGKLDYKTAKEMCESFDIDIDSLDIEIPINPSKLQNKIILDRKNKIYNFNNEESRLKIKCKNKGKVVSIKRIEETPI